MCAPAQEKHSCAGEVINTEWMVQLNQTQRTDVCVVKASFTVFCFEGWQLLQPRSYPMHTQSGKGSISDLVPAMHFLQVTQPSRETQSIT